MSSRYKKREEYFLFHCIKWKPKSLYQSVLPISIINWITGFNILEYPSGKPRPIITIVYALCCAAFYWSFKFINSCRVDFSILTTFANSIYTYIYYMNTTIAAVCILTNWFFYKTLRRTSKRLELVDMAMENIGFSKHYQELFIICFLEVMAWIATISILLTNAIQILMRTKEWLSTLYLFHAPLHCNSIVDFTFASMIKCMGVRFRNINSILQKILIKYKNPRPISKFYPKWRRAKIFVKPKEINLNINDIQQQTKVLSIIRHLHLEITKLSSKIMEIYQIQITMEMVAHLSNLTAMLYNMFSITYYSKIPLQFKIRSFISVSLWCAIYGYRIININSTCAKVNNESYKTSVILCELKNSNIDREFNEEIEQFSLQLFQHPLVFSPCGLITLNYSFVKSFIGTVITYLVILIQMSPEMSKHK